MWPSFSWSSLRNYLYNLNIISAICCNLPLICYTCTAMLLHLLRLNSSWRSCTEFHYETWTDGPLSSLHWMLLWLQVVISQFVQISVKLLKINVAAACCVKPAKCQTLIKYKNRRRDLGTGREWVGTGSSVCKVKEYKISMFYYSFWAPTGRNVAMIWKFQPICSDLRLTQRELASECRHH